MLNDCSNSACALHAAIDEQDRLIEAAESRLRILRNAPEPQIDPSDHIRSQASPLRLWNPVVVPAANKQADLGQAAGDQASKLLELRAEVQALRAKLGA